MSNFLRYLRPLKEKLTPDDVDSYKAFGRVLRSCESPSFTGYQVLYWLSATHHSGQNSLGYVLSSQSPYTPSFSENVESLMEVDFDFEKAYLALEPLAVKYF